MPPPPSDNFPNQASEPISQSSLLPSDASSRRALRTQRSITNYSRARTQERPPQPTRSTAKDMKAALQLDFIVIGAGVSGLATAYALAQSGHRVRIYEKREAIHNEKRAVGVRVPPNMSKILYDWGLYDQLSAALKCRKSAFHSSALPSFSSLFQTSRQHAIHQSFLHPSIYFLTPFIKRSGLPQIDADDDL
ncbi:hypothetical protein NLJ89_g12211 [Agrocybe chaxingu]|uniref:FAD dependent oxidoreductase domain-containing protein n=1 Tax=Agrocybe chaxingu TaxID=84603 RepID=A0A9W8JMQ6_9AGAR|nr:hypothetical protein NLJ89_g12211 [Agrocybe chaxingu]